MEIHAGIVGNGNVKLNRVRQTEGTMPVGRCIGDALFEDERPLRHGRFFHRRHHRIGGGGEAFTGGREGIVGVHRVLDLFLIHIGRTNDMFERNAHGRTGSDVDVVDEDLVAVTGDVVYDFDVMEIHAGIVGDLHQIIDRVIQTECCLSFGRCIGDALFEDKASCRLRDKRLAALIL